MTEYWKSNARKFCDYCKCWFADNKPSIDFHNAGKKHKENVAKKLQEIGQRGRDDYDTSLRMDEYMQKMEQAALKAYKNDIGQNPDLMGTAIVDIAKEKNADIVLQGEVQERVKPPPPANSNSKWLEANSSDGKSYYFHTDTRETKWEVPSEGFISIDEQKLLKQQKKAAKKKKKEDKSSDPGKGCTDQSATAVSSVAGSDSTFSNNTPDADQPAMDLCSSSHAYGSWQTIKKTAMPDFQLPKVAGAEEFDEKDYFDPLPKQAPHKFTQKTVTLGESATGTSFKRKKHAEASKKNARMRNNDL